MLKKSLILLLLLCTSLFAGAQWVVKDQNPKAEEQFKNTADKYFVAKNYPAALEYYLLLLQRYPENTDYRFKAGLCYIHKSDEKQKAIEFLEEVKIKKPATKDIDLYIAKAYHTNYRFQPAIAKFQEILKKKQSTETETEIKRLIDQCKYAQELVEISKEIKIENIGPPVNTDNSEGAPVISADESVLIFTYKGERSTGGLQNEFGIPDDQGNFFEDVFISFKQADGKWSEPAGIGPNINTNMHDASIGLSADGQKLLLYKDTKENSGDIFISQLDGNTWSTPSRMGGDINSSSWEGSATISGDEKVLYFASERPGGFGGRDLWMVKTLPNGEWGLAQNSGSVINTAFDEEAPFMHPDGVTLYFSSNGHRNMGGHDIFRSTLVDDTAWTLPENMGYPINTTDDDKFYIESANGSRGFYSTSRLGGYGQNDIYAIDLSGIKQKHALMVVRGKITANDKLVGADINVTFDNGANVQGVYRSNSVTGRYLLALPAGEQYEAMYEYPGFTPKVETFNTKETTEYIEVIRDIMLYSDDYKAPSMVTLDGNISFTSDGKPAANTKVTIISEDSSFMDKVFTDADGHFEFTNLPGNLKYKISPATDKEMVIAGMATSGGSPLPGFTLNNMKTDKEGKYRITIPGSGKDMLTMEGNLSFLGQPDVLASKVKVTIFSKNGAIKQEVMTMGKGYFIFEKLPDGEEYILDVNTNHDVTAIGQVTKEGKPKEKLKINDGFTDNQGLFKTTLYKKDDIALREKPIMEVNIDTLIADTDLTSLPFTDTLPKEKTITVEGVVFFAEDPNKPAANVKVTIKSRDGKVIRETTTDEKGYYRFENLPADKQYDISVYPDKNATISGKAMDRDGNPLSGVSINGIITGNDGIYTFEIEGTKEFECSKFIVQTLGVENLNLTDPVHYKKMIEKFGDTKAEGLVFKVQIAAYYNARNFDYSKLIDLGKVDAQLLSDGITRFTIGRFNSLNEAEAMRNNLISRGIKDAFITLFCKGERKILSESVSGKFGK